MSIILWCIGLLSIGFLYPTIYTSVWFGNSVAYACLALSLVYLLLNFKRIPRINSTFLIIVGIWWLYFFIREYAYNEPEAMETCNSLIYSMIFMLFILTALGFRKTWDLFMWSNLIMIVLCVIGVGLMLSGLHLPVISTFEINDNQMLQNYGFFFQKTHNIAGVDVLYYLRPNGFYDEPGSFAFMIFLVLMFNKMYVKDSKIEIAFLVGGFVTMSLAHIITSIGYYFLFFFKKNNTGKALIILVVFVLFYFERPVDDGSYLYSVWNRVYGRLEGFVAGEDTSRDFNASFEAFKGFFLTGGSQKEILYAFPNAERSTLWFFMARHGILGTMIYMIIFIVPLIRLVRTKNSDGLKLLFLLALNFVQRPYLHFPILMLPIYMILFANIEATQWENNIKLDVKPKTT